ncbi:MAG: ABC transporter ATP-binding protein [Candidatus Hodarchaeales archaeon]
MSIKYPNEKNKALIGINFAAQEGELIIVAGSSGSGKSTLAQTILGLIPSFIKANKEGFVKINGHFQSEISRKELIQLVGYIPQYPADFTTSLLVEEEIAFLLENLAFPAEEIKYRITQVLNQLDIPHLRHRLITELSSGELQRVAIANVLTHRPKILILDEPMARIDPKTEINLAKILKELTLQGHLILAFEHRLDYLIPFADRLLLLEEGKLICDDRPELLLGQIKDVDLPEVSELHSPGNHHRYLTLEEAKIALLEKIVQ